MQTFKVIGELYFINKFWMSASDYMYYLACSDFSLKVCYTIEIGVNFLLRSSPVQLGMVQLNLYFIFLFFCIISFFK